MVAQCLYYMIFKSFISTNHIVHHGSHALTFNWLLFQVFLIGMLFGSFRVVLPIIAESEFYLTSTSSILISSVVLAFGCSKAVFNLLAGAIAGSIQHSKILFYGWLVALPIPYFLYYSNSWGWITVALTLLGINQGLNWSITQTAKIEIIKNQHRGHAMGLNEFFGYVGVASAGAITATLAEFLSAKESLVLFIALIIFMGIFTTFKTNENNIYNTSLNKKEKIKLLINKFSELWGQFYYVSWKNKQLMALCQAGFVEKFIDALVWLYFPLYFLSKGLTVIEISLVVGVYSFTWGSLQFFTGKLSDLLNRISVILFGMCISSVGLVLNLILSGLLWWLLCAMITGVGMALLYPNLSAAVTDEVKFSETSTTLGIYRFWRDLGYAGSTIAFVSATFIKSEHSLKIIVVSICMLVSAIILFKYKIKNN